MPLDWRLSSSSIFNKCHLNRHFLALLQPYSYKMKRFREFYFNCCACWISGGIHRQRIKRFEVERWNSPNQEEERTWDLHCSHTWLWRTGQWRQYKGESQLFSTEKYYLFNLIFVDLLYNFCKSKIVTKSSDWYMPQYLLWYMLSLRSLIF